MATPRTKTKRPTALITGGALGIGQALAESLAGCGYDIGIITRKNEAAARRVVAHCEKSGVAAKYWVGDLTDIETTEKIAAEFLRHFKQWDVLINNVGDYWAGPVLRMKTETLKAMFQSNFSVAARLSALAIKAMRRRKYGRIVNIGYVFADRLHANPRVAAYQAAKTALLSYSASLAKEAMRDGITINTVSPGVHHNTVEPPDDVAAMIPAGRVSTDADIWGAVWYFLSDDAAYVTASHLKVSGGYGV